MKLHSIPTGLKQSAFTIIGNGLSAGLSALAIIFIIRLLGPEKYGEFSVGLAIALILVKLNDWGLNTAILKYASDNKNQKELTTKYKLILSLVISIIGLLSYQYINSFLGLKEPRIILAAFTFGLFTTYYEHLLNILQSLHSFFNAVAINTIQAIAKLVGSGLFFILIVQQTMPLFLWYLFAPLIPVLLTRWLLPSWIKINLSVKNLKLQQRIWSLTKHSSIALISAGIIENIDILFLQSNLTTYETGLYGGVSRIAMLFTLIAYSLANVLNSRVARYKLKKHLAPYLKKSWGVVLLSLLGFLIFIPIAKPLIHFTIGQEYLNGLPVLLMLTGASFLAIASMPFMALFYSFEADWYFSISGILQLVIILIGNAIFVPIFGLEAAAWTRLATRLFLFLFTMLLGQYLYFKHYGKQTI